MQVNRLPLTRGNRASTRAAVQHSNKGTRRSQSLSSYLLLDAERVDVAEGDVPGVEPVGVVGARREEERGGEEEGGGGESG